MLLYVKIIWADACPFYIETGPMSGLRGVLAQGGTAAPRLGCFRNFCHLGKLDEILFADCNLQLILLIDFKLVKVEGQNRALC